MAVGVTALLSGLTASVCAEEAAIVCPICQRANDQQAAYSQKAGITLLRGMVNTTFGWTELLVQPAAEVNGGGHLVVGIGKGIGYAAKRTVLGVGELLTFWTPKGRQGYLTLTENCPVCLSARQPGQTVPTKPAP
jgi:putative exosortase-associated protein (TIGR04073 family)